MAFYDFFRFAHRSPSSAPPPYPYPVVRPYIGLRARLSQIWLNQYTLMLIIIVTKLVLFQKSLSYALDSSRKYTMSSCGNAEELMSQAASMPHHMATAANKAIDKSMDAAIKGLIEVLLLIIAGVENLIIFALELWIGTYACLATAAVDGTAGAALNATQSAIKFVNSTLDDITDGLEDGLKGLSNVINTLEGAAEDVADFFTGKDDDDGSSDIKKVNLQIDALKNIHIPASVNEKLAQLQKDLPTYDDVKNSTEQLIREPFDTLKDSLNRTMQSEIKAIGTSQHIQIPQESKISFCQSSDPGIPQFYDDVQHAVLLATKVLIIVMLVAAVLVCVPIAWREIKQWRWMKQCAADRQAEQLQGNRDAMVAIHDANNRVITKTQKVVSNRFNKDENKLLARWWVDYVLYEPAATTLIIALVGILMVILQYIVLYQVKKAIPHWQSTVQNVTTALTTAVKTDTSAWVNSTNDAIITRQTKVNDNLLGWVGTATSSVNKTLVTFQNNMNNALKDTFEGTPLYDPISSVVYCVIGSKLTTAEHGLTWVHDHAKVSFPTIDADFLADNSTSFNPEEAGKDASDLLGTVLSTLVEAYEKALKLELYIACVLLVCWLLVALAGLLYCFFHSRPRSKVEKVDIGRPTAAAFEPPLRSPHPPTTPVAQETKEAPFELHDDPVAVFRPKLGSPIKLDKAVTRASVKPFVFP